MPRALLPILLALLVSGCLEEAGTIQPGTSEESDLVSPFSSQVTGYLSDGALELDATFEGVMKLSLAGQADPQRFVADLRDGVGVAELAVEHMRFAHRPLLPAKQRLNLTNAGLAWYEVVETDGQAQVRYRLTTESLVAWKDLEADNVGPTSLVGKSYSLLLPADPRKVFDRVGESCSRERGDNDHLNNFTYFYYFDSAKQGCDLQTTWATLTIDRLHMPLGTYYPEYDRLTADGKITVAIFFDGATEQPSSNYDQSNSEFRELRNSLERMGFARLEDLEPFGARYTRTRNDIEQIVDMVGPTEWSAMADTQEAFHLAVQTHEIIAYQGHAFIGMLNLFDRPASYPAGTYQIFLVGSCWGYHYYVDQILKHKATSQDPSGWEFVDVVAATERPYFSNGGDQIRILLTNVLKGAETGGADDERRYDWKSIIEAMNRRVEEWYEVYAPWVDKSDNDYYMKEIYGASGVLTNCYDPRDPQKCTGCSDECPQSGQTRCQDNRVSTCANHDNDSCLEWGEPVACKADESCLDGACLQNCTDDSYEDNDLPDNASGTGGDLSALQICLDDADWYRVAAEDGDTLMVEILFAHQAGDLDLELYGESDLESALAVSVSSTDNERISLPVENQGSYYIQVIGYASAENSYRMIVALGEGGQDCHDECYEEGLQVCAEDGTQFCSADHDTDDCLEWGPVISCNGLACEDGHCHQDQDSQCTDDAYEDNDSRTSASAVSDGTYDMQLCDDDWYRIELQSGDRLDVSIAFEHGLGDLDLELTDEAQNLLQSSTSTNNTETVGTEATGPGFVYLRVYGYSGAQGAYSLSIGITSSGGNGCQDDRFEPNDDFTQAYELSGLTWGPNSYPGLMVCSDDQDWYAVFLYDGEVLNVDLAFSHASGDIDIRIFDQNQVELAAGISSDDNESVTFEADQDRTVYLKIFGFDGAENAYDMLVTVL